MKWWKPRHRRWIINQIPVLISVLVVLTLLAVLVAFGYPGFVWDWTGFSGATLWDWLKLLIVPAMIAVGGMWFNQEQSRRVAVQTYLDQMTQLLVNKSALLLLSDKNTREVIHARTLHVLEQLDKKRKKAILRFLYKTDLLEPIVSKTIDGVPWSLVYDADLRRVNLRTMNLSNACLAGVDMRKADLKETILQGANLQKAKLQGARNLTQEQLEDAFGDESTKLPKGLEMPKSWAKRREQTVE